MSPDAKSPTEADALETLRTLLQSASNVLTEFTADPLFPRLVHVFSAMPHADREPILAVLEREVQARRTAEVAGDMTGLFLRPNPNARLYTRIVGEDPRPNPDRAVMTALRAIQITHAAVSPMDSEWKTIARDALRAVGREERTSVEKFTRELLDLLRELAETETTRG
jgi:hypothetical protein